MDHKTRVATQTCVPTALLLLLNFQNNQYYLLLDKILI